MKVVVIMFVNFLSVSNLEVKKEIFNLINKGYWYIEGKNFVFVIYEYLKFI